MNVTNEKLEEIYKVYDEKRNNRIPTVEIGTHHTNKQNLFDQPGCSPASKT